MTEQHARAVCVVLTPVPTMDDPGEPDRIDVVIRPRLTPGDPMCACGAEVLA